LSGAGAARHGGRWNRPGQATLYLSESIETAFAEYQQELGARPGTFVAYDVTGGAVADVCDPRVLAELGAQAADLLGPWKEATFVKKVDPPTWTLTDRLQGRFDGVRVPSSQYRGGANLVLWRRNDDGEPAVEPLDPEFELTSPAKPGSG